LPFRQEYFRGGEVKIGGRVEEWSLDLCERSC
jgi:hypothetical protein